MDSNNLNDISKIYLEQVSMQLDEKEKEKPKRWWDDDGDNIGYEEGEVSGRFKKKKIKEALVGGQTKIDANKNGEIDSQDFEILRSTKKKKITKEGYSNWREDLIEVVGKISKDKSEDVKITEKEVNNKIDINPKLNLGERVEELGGTLLEISEIEDFDGVFDDLSESEIFLLSDQLIEEVVEEFFYECLEEGYALEEVENTLLESLEISSALLNEERVTYGHDTDVKSNRLEKVKTAVKNTGKKLVRGAGYLGGLAVRSAKAVGRELGAGYKRGRHGSSGSSSGSGSSPTTQSSTSQRQRSRVTQGSGVETSSGSGSSRPGLLGRIGSKLKRGLARVAKSVSRRSRNFARRLEQGSSSGSGSSPTTQSSTSQRQRSRVTQGSGVETPSAVHSKAGVRSASPRRGISGGKRVEVAGERKKEQPVQRVSVRDVTQPKPKPESKAPVGTSGNPRVGQPASKSKPTVKTRTVSTRGFGSFKPTQSGEEAYQKEKEKQETKKNTKRTRSSSRGESKEPNPKKPGAPSLDDLLKSEQFQIDEKTLSTAETKKKKQIFKSVTIDKLRKQYPKKSENELESLRYALSTAMAKKIAEQAMELQPKSQAPAKEKPLDTTIERQKYSNLKMMQQKKQQLQRQELNLKKQGKLPLETN